jgi:hypothetical protein
MRSSLPGLSLPHDSSAAIPASSPLRNASIYSGTPLIADSRFFFVPLQRLRGLPTAVVNANASALQQIKRCSAVVTFRGLALFDSWITIV